MGEVVVSAICDLLTLSQSGAIHGLFQWNRGGKEPLTCILMQTMRRAALVFVVLVAAAVAFEPLIHTHPISQSTSVPCAICVGAVAHVTSPRLSVASPLVIVAAVAPLAVSPTVNRAEAPRVSRAPPAA